MSLLLADRFIDRIIINVNVNVYVSPCSPYGPCESGQVLSNGQKTSVSVPEREEGGAVESVLYLYCRWIDLLTGIIIQ